MVDLPSYLSGYVDGEGCFTVSIAPRPTLRVGWEVRPSLSVSQNGDRREVLLLLQEYFESGTLRPDRSDKTLKWEVRSLDVLINRVVPHFETYRLLSGKQKDFEAFAEICRRMVRGQHLLPAGLREIVRLAREMNPSGRRGYEPSLILTSITEMKA
jgi:LAGLIDADG endonuclease